MDKLSWTTIADVFEDIINSHSVWLSNFDFRMGDDPILRSWKDSNLRAVALLKKLRERAVLAGEVELTDGVEDKGETDRDGYN